MEPWNFLCRLGTSPGNLAQKQVEPGQNCFRSFLNCFQLRNHCRITYPKSDKIGPWEHHQKWNSKWRTRCYIFFSSTLTIYNTISYYTNIMLLQIYTNNIHIQISISKICTIIISHNFKLCALQKKSYRLRATGTPRAPPPLPQHNEYAFFWSPYMSWVPH